MKNFLKWLLHKPKLTKEQIYRELEYRWLDNDWQLVCSTCGGNCGQCGITQIVGNIPFDFERLVKNSVWGKGR